MERKLNRAERRRLDREQRPARNQQKIVKKMIQNNIKAGGTGNIMLRCPDCNTIDIKEIRPDFFRCNKCGAEHPLSELSCEL